MANKDFLDQFTGENNKPASFKEEERVKVTKEKKPINVKLLVIILAAIVLLIGLILFLVLRPTIEVKNFVGENAAEVKAWIKQNDIESQGIVFREEYNFDYDEGYVISQSIGEGKKVRKDVKMDFVVSQGADPDELISIPDFESMYKEEIQDWIKENKLTKTKVMSVFNDDVEDGAVVSYEFKSGADADNFKRSSTLNITVSKGPAPASSVIVDDFVKQDYTIVEAWAKKNKVELIKTTNYSDKIAKDLVISQSIEPKKTIKEGESLTVVVSLGKGILIPNFASMSNSDIDEWIKENAGYCKIKEMYSSQDSYVLEQSIKSGNFIDEENKLHLTINKGDHFYLDEIGFSIKGNSYDKFKDYAKDLEEIGIYIDTHRNYVDSDLPEGTIISINKIFDEDYDYSEVQKLPLVVEITCNISNGNKPKEKEQFVYSEFIDQSASYLNDWIKTKYSKVKVEFDIKEGDPTDLDMYTVKEIKYLEKGDVEPKDIRLSDGYLKDGTTLIVTVEAITE